MIALEQKRSSEKNNNYVEKKEKKISFAAST